MPTGILVPTTLPQAAATLDRVSSGPSRRSVQTPDRPEE